MENRLVVTRFKDGYGPVGAFFLYLKAVATNAAGENYEVTRRAELRERVGAYADAKPLPTCLRNHLMLREILEGRGPILMHTERVIDSDEKEKVAWGAFLNMTVGQAVTWAAQGTDPRKVPSGTHPLRAVRARIARGLRRRVGERSLGPLPARTITGDTTG